MLDGSFHISVRELVRQLRRLETPCWAARATEGPTAVRRVFALGLRGDVRGLRGSEINMSAGILRLWWRLLIIGSVSGRRPVKTSEIRREESARYRGARKERRMSDRSYLRVSRLGLA